MQIDFSGFAFNHAQSMADGLGTPHPPAKFRAVEGSNCAMPHAPAELGPAFGLQEDSITIMAFISSAAPLEFIYVKYGPHDEVFLPGFVGAHTSIFVAGHIVATASQLFSKHAVGAGFPAEIKAFLFISHSSSEAPQCVALPHCGSVDSD